MILCPSCKTLPSERAAVVLTSSGWGDYLSERFHCDCGMLQRDGSKTRLILATDESILFQGTDCAMFQKDAISAFLSNRTSRVEKVRSPERLREIVDRMICQRVLES